MEGGVDLLAGAGGKVGLQVDGVAIERPMAGLDLNLPAVGGADRIGAGCFAIEQERRAVADLRNRGQDTPIPDGRGNEIFSCAKQRGEVEALIAPMAQVAPGRAVANALAVDVQHKAIVGADAYRVADWDRIQGQRAAEVEHDGLPQRGGWMGDPGGLPGAVRGVGRFGFLGLAWGVEGEEGQCDSDKSENKAHDGSLPFFKSSAYREKEPLEEELLSRTCAQPRFLGIFPVLCA